MKTTILLSALITTIACNQPDHNDTPDNIARANADTPQPRARATNSATPQDVAQLRALLLARHTPDLPRKVQLSRHRAADASLRWLAQNDPLLMVRGRALALLRLYPNPASETVLRTTLAAHDTAPQLRAAAARGLAGFPLVDRDDLRSLIEAELTSPDIEVAYAAIEALDGIWASRPALAAVRDRSDTPRQLQRVAARILMAPHP